VDRALWGVRGYGPGALVIKDNPWLNAQETCSNSCSRLPRVTRRRMTDRGKRGKSDDPDLYKVICAPERPPTT
jgi:hypothetical protein